MTKSFQLKDRIKSFEYAFKGVSTMLKSQHNARIHAVSTLIVIVAGFIFSISKTEWCFLVLSVMSVWTAEALNTALEFLADVASPDFHPLVEKAKDVAAGAVLITAICSVIIGLFVFIPNIEKLIK
jgi:diacylglycerol kinase (ATP)